MNKFLNDIFRAPWAIQPEYAERMEPFLHKLLESHNFPTELTEDRSTEPMSVTTADGTWKRSMDDAPKGSVAVIEMVGAVVKYGFCGGGTADMKDFVKRADNHQNISSIVFKIDSPGGSVAGTLELAEALRTAKKPTIAFVDDLAASAGYWIASAADEVIANNKTAVVGSIGVVAAWADLTPAYEKEGVVFHRVFASTSPDKQKVYLEANKGKYDKLIAELDRYHAEFIASVERNRSGKLGANKADIMTGKTYFADDALSFGMIDGIDTFDNVIQRAADMGKRATKRTITI